MDEKNIKNLNEKIKNQKFDFEINKIMCDSFPKLKEELQFFSKIYRL